MKKAALQVLGLLVVLAGAVGPCLSWAAEAPGMPDDVVLSDGKEAFPADYKPEDFAVSTKGMNKPALKPVFGVSVDTLENVLEQTEEKDGQKAAPAAVKPVGKKFNINELPRTGTSLTGQSGGNGGRPAKAGASDALAVLPQPAVPMAESLPRTTAEAMGWGVVSERGRWFGVGPWQKGSEASLLGDVERLLAKIEQHMGQSALLVGKNGGSLALTQALESLLLTAAEAPKLQNKDDGLWLARRAEVLQRLQRDEAAWRLWQAVPATAIDQHEGLALQVALARLVAGDVGVGCGVVLKWAGKGAKTYERDWRKSVLVCQILERKDEAARLSWQLLQEQKVDAKQKADDKTFESVVGAMLAGAGKSAPARDADIVWAGVEGNNRQLLAALVAAEPKYLTVAMTKELPSVALRRLMNTGGLPLKMRLSAAEELAARSGEDADGRAVALLYLALHFDEKDLADPVGKAAALSEARHDNSAARALLWQAASGQGPMSLRAASWDKWRQMALSDGLTGLPLVMPVMVAGMGVEKDSVWLTPMVVADAWRKGDFNAAKQWLAAAERVADKGVIKDKLPLWQLQTALLMGENVPEDRWVAWLGQGGQKESLKESGGKTAFAAEYIRLVTVADILGVAVPDAVKNRLLDMLAVLPPEAAPSVSWRYAIDEVLAAKKGGEALLWAVMPQAGEAVGAAGWWEPRLRVLQANGLDAFARRYAGEIFAYGFAPAAEEARPVPVVIQGVEKQKKMPGSRPENKGIRLGGAEKKAASMRDEDDYVVVPPRVK